MARWLFAGLIFGLLNLASWAQSAKTSAGTSTISAPDRHAQFREQVRAQVDGDDFVGLAYAIVTPGRATQIETFGVKDISGVDKVGPLTRFRIASLSKGFAGTVAGELIREDRLRLSTPLSEFRPDFRLKTASAVNIPIEHILTHRMGLPPNAYDNLLEDGVAVASIEKRLRTVKPICSPGSCYSYQNVTFDLIVDVIERIEGQPYSQIVSDRLFKPLGMMHASLGRAALQADEDWARPHRRRRGENWRVISVQPNYYRLPGAAGINASIADMAQWLRAQMGQSPNALSEQTLKIIHTPRTNTLSETRRKARRMPGLTKTAYGLGWRVYTYAGETVITHSGAVAGYAASIAFIPERQTGIVLLSNANTRAFHQLVPRFLDQELGRSISPS